MPDPPELAFFNPYEDIRETRTNLPHWQQHGRVHFVTFRLADSLPQVFLTEWEEEKLAWLAQHPEPWSLPVELEYHARFSARIELWLDKGHGECLLRDSEYRQTVAEALRFFEGERYHVLAFVIMPNHVHTLMIPAPPWNLEQLLHSWKSYTAHELNAKRGQSGRVWMRDYFDRLIRDETHFQNCVRYIRRNPEKAYLRPGEYTLWESDLCKDVE